MSDAIGGVVNVALVVFFLTVIALYMAFSVNYQKAFNVKNKIVSIYEEYSGNCTTSCKNDILAYEQTLGYGKHKMTEQANEKCFNQYGYCIKGIQSSKPVKTYSEEARSNTKYCYFRIRTQVEIDIPLINNLMGLKLFQITGQTSSIKVTTSKDCKAIAETGYQTN